MKLVKVNEVPREPYIDPIFTSSDVAQQKLLPESKDFEANIVNFGRGTRNKFHAHASDQILIVTAGKGFVATEEEKKVVTAGDIIFSLRVKSTGTVLPRTQTFPISI
ncbi:hypothetical protein ACFLV3_05615 [Chloroflexota bacterium]